MAATRATTGTTGATARTATQGWVDTSVDTSVDSVDTGVTSEDMNITDFCDTIDTSLSPINQS